MVERAHELAEAVSSGEAVPGSGWVAGISGGLAAALVSKAALRSEGWLGAEGARAQALELRDRLLALAEQDARAYERALSALERRDASLNLRSPGPRRFRSRSPRLRPTSPRSQPRPRKPLTEPPRQTPRPPQRSPPERPAPPSASSR